MTGTQGSRPRTMEAETGVGQPQAKESLAWSPQMLEEVKEEASEEVRGKRPEEARRGMALLINLISDFCSPELRE